jgi:hypothetical protein
MRLTPRAVVLVFIGIAVAMLLRPVEAQTESSPFQVGQRLQLSNTDRTQDCTLVEVRGAFVRCDPGRPDAFSRAPATTTTWYNTASTVFIAVREK